MISLITCFIQCLSFPKCIFNNIFINTSVFLVFNFRVCLFIFPLYIRTVFTFTTYVPKAPPFQNVLFNKWISRGSTNFHPFLCQYVLIKHALSLDIDKILPGTYMPFVIEPIKKVIPIVPIIPIIPGPSILPSKGLYLNWID